MRAVILAAGKGERLKEITQNLPKPMINYKGKPILQHNIELCRTYGITELFLNTHHLHEVIENYFEDGEKFGVKINYSYESELLGTSGAVRKIADDYWNIEENEPFFVIYGDNFSNYNLQMIENKLRDTKSLGSIAFHYRQDTSHSGVAEFDNAYRILKFIEKPKPGESESHWVNAGIYCLSAEILSYIPKGISDFSKDLFPALLTKNLPIYGVCESIDVKAFDTPEMYNKSIQ